MFDEPKMLTIDCKGSTGIVYSGTFTVRPFLTHLQNKESARERNKHIEGLKTTPAFDLVSMVNELQDKLPNIRDEDKVGLNDKQFQQIINIIGKYVPAGDPEADIMSAIALLNAHIIEAPTWWSNGYNLIDYEPVLELNRQLKLLQANLVKNSTTG